MDTVQAYKKWLIDRIAIPNPAEYEYHNLFDQLMTLPFYSAIHEDSLRIDEALYLRRSFARTFHNGLSEKEKVEFYEALGPASVFEILAIMVEKMSYQLMGNRLADSTPFALFLELLDNSGLSYLTDRAYAEDADSCRKECAEIVTDILNHCYDFDGNGGFFPLDTPVADMTSLDLKQQMELYLVEKYEILE